MMKKSRKIVEQIGLKTLNFVGIARFRYNNKTDHSALPVCLSFLTIDKHSQSWVVGFLFLKTPFQIYNKRSSTGASAQIDGYLKITPRVG